MAENLKDDNQYRSMAKGTAMMGGVQVFNIIINLIRGKLVAMFLGPQGMGVMSLLQSSGTMIQQVSSCGLNLSAVKEVSATEEKRNHVIAVIRKLLIISSLLGVVATIVLSSGLSKLSFGSLEYTWYYVFLSLWVFLTTLANGELAILQGAHALKRLAKATLIGSCTGLFIGVPLYYLFGEKGIVPALIASALALFIFYKYHSVRQFGKIPTNETSLKDNLCLVKKLVSLGFIFMISSLLGTVTTYLINYFVRRLGSIEDVGLFQAANSLTNQYAGLVFAAMSMDFFPRLSAVSSNDTKIKELVNSQLEIVVLLFAPIIVLIIICAPIIIKLLLSEEFLSISPVVKIMAYGIFLKAIIYPMGYISFAKGDKKTFFVLEGVLGNLLHLILSVAFYYLWGVTGLGIAFCAGFFIYIFVYVFVTKKMYNYSMTRGIVILVFLLSVSIMVSLCCSFAAGEYWSYIVMCIIAVLLLTYCTVQLNKRIDFVNYLKKRLFKS